MTFLAHVLRLPRCDLFLPTGSPRLRKKAGVFLCYETVLPDGLLLSSPVGLLGMTVSAMNAHYSVNSFAWLMPRPNKLFFHFLLHFVTSSGPGCPRRTVVTTTRTHGHP